MWRKCVATSISSRLLVFSRERGRLRSGSVRCVLVQGLRDGATYMIIIICYDIIRTHSLSLSLCLCLALSLRVAFVVSLSKRITNTFSVCIVLQICVGTTGICICSVWPLGMQYRVYCCRYSQLINSNGWLRQFKCSARMTGNDARRYYSRSHAIILFKHTKECLRSIIINFLDNLLT